MLRQGLVFDTEILKSGTPIHIKGHDNEGDAIDRYVLIRSTQPGRLFYTTANGGSGHIDIKEVESDSMKITLLTKKEDTSKVKQSDS